MCLYPISCYNPITDTYKKFPCGKCYECLQKKANEVALRCMLEANQHKDNCFITLTYAESPVTLIKKDLQDFIKRLRKRIQPVKIRYRACGEYGSKHLRPHFHIIIFGWKPDDLQFLKFSGSEVLYKSEFLFSVWQNKGFVSVGEVTSKSARYTAKYMQKLQSELPDGLLPPFSVQSLKPGLGYFAMSGIQELTGKIYFDGKAYLLPRYFVDCLERDFGCDLTDLREKRKELMSVSLSDTKLINERRERAKDFERKK